MVFDTDVLIWFLRGSAKAARAIDAAGQRFISVVTYMELIQGARDKREIRTIKMYLADLRFEILPLSENIGHRASIYMEEYRLASSLNMADALVAASVIENGEKLLTGNVRHFRAIKELQCHPFRS